ncbi:hypothetical protein H3H54_00750 [Brachybacterium sp. Z12]|uniref:sulfatase/phosphatase domain-containing protein n=1 Tax=Brachybacterium sp. Z12 TaxID=2759167 RepID=UPI0018627F0D|nr:sulfatase/phosphatase domain-containing protein [Brachybacterium sp. Z12]QNN82578.1 hypothetical protein H3H54_00750 [Brachybacterium sp. Z12]
MLDESMPMPMPMPMLVRWPAQIAAGTRITDTISNVDFAATLLEAAGEESQSLPAQQGRSFLRELHGEQVPDWLQAVYYRYWEHDDPEHTPPPTTACAPPPTSTSATTTTGWAPRLLGPHHAGRG